MPMLANGVNAKTGEPLMSASDEAAFARAVESTLARTRARLLADASAGAAGTDYRSGIERAPAIDLADPRAVGWTFLVRADDPRKDEIVRRLAPLAAHRGMTHPDRPLLWDAATVDDWQDWLEERYLGLVLDGQRSPHYVLIVGSPSDVPFHFQSMLGAAAAVGRLDVESLDELDIYVQKVLAQEAATESLTSRAALFFAPNAGLGDATYYTQQYMAAPLADHAGTRCAKPVTRVFDAEATKGRLVEEVARLRPALLYSASHGVGVAEPEEDERRALNGAICCQQETRRQPMEARTFAASDVPMDAPFIEGGMLFQFACFGYGTPAASDFSPWTPDVLPTNAVADFTAALPRRLLAHPRGPVAYVGHVDLAWLHAFTNPTSPLLDTPWHARLAPFASAVEALLQGQPVGLAMADMSRQFTISSLTLAKVDERRQRGTLVRDEAFEKRLVDRFIQRNDAQNYLILGDPAARLRLPAP